jgi:hypothetical protein
MQPARVKIRWGKVFLGILLIGIGLYVLAVRVALGSLNSLQSGKWPTITGTITQSEMLTTQDKGKTSYTARVSYSYYANNHLYSGNTVYFGCCGGDQDEENAILRRYPLKSEAKVYYHPADPAISVLEPGLHTKDLLIFVFVGLFALTAGVVILATGRIKIID